MRFFFVSLCFFGILGAFASGFKSGASAENAAFESVLMAQNFAENGENFSDKSLANRLLNTSPLSNAISNLNSNLSANLGENSQNSSPNSQISTENSQKSVNSSENLDENSNLAQNSSENSLQNANLTQNLNKNSPQNAPVLTPKQAFKITQGSDSQGVFVKISLANGIFLYKNQLKVLLNGSDITGRLTLPSHIIKDGEEVFYKAVRLDLPQILLENLGIERARLRLLYQGCADSGFCYRPMNAEFSIASELRNGLKLYKIAFSSEKAQNFSLKSENSNSSKFTHYLQEKNVFLTLAIFFGYGLLLSLTPCTLPMVPILSALILAQSAEKPSKKRGFALSLVYVLFMSLAYAIAGVITAALGASVQGLLQKPLVLGFFALILVLLALACFGVFSLSLPQNLAKFTPKHKGIASVAVMGFLSAFIVGPCVAAPLGAALLYIANSGDFALGGLSLFVLSCGMGVPLLFVGAGLGFIRAGAWMQKINTLFGFVMLAMAVWVLARIMPNALTLALYGVLGVFFAVFMGLFEAATNTLARLKKAVLLLVLAYSLSLFLGGLWGGKSLLNPLNLGIQSEKSDLNFEFLGNLNEIQNAITQNDKVLLDFTASWCENCRLLDEKTFADGRVREALKPYKLVKIDISDNDEAQLEIMREFGVFAPPVLIFFEKGSEKSRLVGFVGVAEFLQNLQNSQILP